MANEANDNRVQGRNNRYITGEREILHAGPDDYHAPKGADAIDRAATAAPEADVGLRLDSVSPLRTPPSTQALPV